MRWDSFSGIGADSIYLIPNERSSKLRWQCASVLYIAGFIEHAEAAVGQVDYTGLGCLDGVPSPAVVEADIRVFGPL